MFVETPINYLHGHAEQEGEEVHDGEARQQLSLQEHGGVVVVAVLHRHVVLVRSIHLVVHYYHVHHHSHHRHAEEEADEEGLPPPVRGLETDRTQAGNDSAFTSDAFGSQVLALTAVFLCCGQGDWRCDLS